MSDVAYCYFKTGWAAEHFMDEVDRSFQVSSRYTTDTPLQGRSVVVEVREHDGGEMAPRIFATLLTICNKYDGLISNDAGDPSSPARGRPGGAPFVNHLPEGITAEASQRCSVCGEKGCVQATHQYCSQSGGEPGQDNTTHHLVNRAKGMTCTHCGQTQKQIEGR